MLFIPTLIIVNTILAIIVRIYSKLTTGICKCSRHLVGKVVIVTSSNSGVNFETAKDLAARGARVILAYNVKTEGTGTRDSIVAMTGNNDVHCRQLDFTSLSSVKAFVNDIIKTEKRVDILINNAEVDEADNVKTEDGLSLHMQINYFGPFLLTSLLLPILKSSAPSRIINVSSDAYRRAKIEFDNLNNEKETRHSYNYRIVYQKSKLCNVLMTLELARRLEGTKVTANCCNPGIVFNRTATTSTLIFRYFQNIQEQLFKNPWEGAQTAIYLAVSPEVENISGKYYSDCRERIPVQLAKDKDVARTLWDVSEELVGLKKIKNYSIDYYLFLIPKYPHYQCLITK